MVEVKFKKINNSALSSLDITEGQIIFVQDTGKLYLDKDDTHRIQVDGINYTGSNGITITNKNITNAGVRAIETGATNGTISVNTNGTNAEVSVYGLGDLAFKSVIDAADMTTGTLPVVRGGTGSASFTSGQVLVGNGTDPISSKAVDTTDGGTIGSSNLITSGAVNAGLATKLNTSLKGAVNGLAELDLNGKVPSSQLPSYVDDVIELLNVTNTAPSTCSEGDKYYNTSSKKIFIATGTNTWAFEGEDPEEGKIYVNLNNNKTYRYSGSDLVVISETLALGETSSTAYRGDRGKTAYTHATDANRLTTAQSEGFYKIATTAEGHIKSINLVQKSDITGLGIPGSDTTYESKSAVSGGTDVSLVTTGEKYTWNNKLDTSDLTDYVKNTDYATNAVAGVSKVSSTYFNGVNSNGNLYAMSRSYAQYQDGNDLAFIGKATLENVITGKGLISNTDYATSSVGGVIKTGSGTQMGSDGTLKAVTYTYSEYPNKNNNSFISKGTLENVITGKGLLVPSDITVTPVQQSGATVGTIQIGNGNAITLYAPQPGNVSTELSSANQTYYLTGVKETAATAGSQIYNTRMSNTFTGLKYQTSTSAEGGTLYVDDREVVLGLYYEIA